MRRGAQLENYINSWLITLDTLGVHGHKNNPLRTIRGDTLKGEPFDYEIFLPEAIHLFDAKECSDKKLHWSIKEFMNISTRHYRQLQALHMCSTNPNTCTYFLVWFLASPERECLRMYSPLQIMKALQSGRKYLEPAEGDEWNIPEMVKFIS